MNLVEMLITGSSKMVSMLDRVQHQITMVSLHVM